MVKKVHRNTKKNNPKRWKYKKMEIKFNSRKMLSDINFNFVICYLLFQLLLMLLVI